MSDGTGAHSDHTDSSVTRRGLLGSLAVAGVTGLAGCGDTQNTEVTTSPTTGTTPTGPPPSATVSPEGDGPPRDRVARVGNAIRPAVALLSTDSTETDAAGVFLRPSLLVTAASVLLSETPELQTFDGQTAETTLLGKTGSSNDDGDDLAAFRVETTAPTIPRGSAADLSVGDIVIHVGHEYRFRDWVIQFGRVSDWADDDERFQAFFPLPTPGGPVVTLDGELIGITAESVPADPPATDVPPPTEAPTVYTDQRRWVDVYHEPISDVRARVAEWTGQGTATTR